MQRFLHKYLPEVGHYAVVYLSYRVTCPFATFRPWKTSVGLTDVARHGHLAAVERTVVNQPQMVDASDVLYKTALMTASASGQIDVVSLLVNKGSV